MKIEKRYIVIALFIAFALSIDMSFSGVLAFVILGSTFYGFHLIAKQSRLDDKKFKQTKNEPTVQKLLKAKQSQDLINWQFESIPSSVAYTNQNELGLLLLHAVSLSIGLIVISTEESLTIKAVYVVVIFRIIGVFIKFFKKVASIDSINNPISIEKIELTPDCLVHKKHNIIKPIVWQDIESIEYLERNKIEPSAIKILVKNQQPIILEQNFLTSEIHTTMEVLKNYWYLCAKGYPLPKIT